MSWDALTWFYLATACLQFWCVLLDIRWLLRSADLMTFSSEMQSFYDRKFGFSENKFSAFNHIQNFGENAIKINFEPSTFPIWMTLCTTRRPVCCRTAFNFALIRTHFRYDRHVYLVLKREIYLKSHCFIGYLRHDFESLIFYLFVEGQPFHDAYRSLCLELAETRCLNIWFTKVKLGSNKRTICAW